VRLSRRKEVESEVLAFGAEGFCLSRSTDSGTGSMGVSVFRNVHVCRRDTHAKGFFLMRKSLLFAASIFFVLRSGAAYGLDVTLGPGGDHTDLESAVSAVHDSGGGRVTILDNALYMGSNLITDSGVSIVIEGNPLDPPTLQSRDNCAHGDATVGQTAATCGGMDDDEDTVIDERTHGMAIIHVQGGNRLPDPDWVPGMGETQDDNPGLPPVPLDGGSVTFNGCMFRSCFLDGPLPGELTQCQYVQLGDAHGRHPVQNYTVRFNDCIFEDVDAGNVWPNANGTNILLWDAVVDTTLNFDNCIIPWNQGGTPGFCDVSFLMAHRSAAPSAGLDITIDQCTIVDKSIFNTYHNFIHSRKADTVVTVTNSIIWPNMARAWGQAFAEAGRFARSFNGTNAGACHEFDFPAGGIDDPTAMPPVVATTVANGGTGYAVDDRLIVQGGTQNLLRPDGNPDCDNYGNPRPAVFRVAEVDGGGAGPGVVTKVEWTGLERRPADPGEMCGAVLISDPSVRPDGVVSGVYDQDGRPANPVTTTPETGAGTGATLNVAWQPDVLGTLMTGTISNSIARWDVNDPIDTGNENDWFNQADPHGVVAIGANVLHAEPMLLRAEGDPPPPPANNRDPLSLIAGNALLPGSPAIGHGDLGQDAGYIQPNGACEIPGGTGGGTCEKLSEADCDSQGGTYGGDGSDCPGGSQLPGNSNQDTSLDLSDVVTLLGFLFQGNPSSLPCSTDAANDALMDVNTDTAIDLSDGIFLLAFLFQGGPPPDQGPVCITIVDCPPNPACP